VRITPQGERATRLHFCAPRTDGRFTFAQTILWPLTAEQWGGPMCLAGRPNKEVTPCVIWRRCTRGNPPRFVTSPNFSTFEEVIRETLDRIRERDGTRIFHRLWTTYSALLRPAPRNSPQPFQPQLSKFAMVPPNANGPRWSIKAPNSVPVCPAMDLNEIKCARGGLTFDAGRCSDVRRIFVSVLCLNRMLDRSFAEAVGFDGIAAMTEFPTNQRLYPSPDKSGHRALRNLSRFLRHLSPALTASGP
jgi:hypothetical protein